VVTLRLGLLSSFILLAGCSSSDAASEPGGDRNADIPVVEIALNQDDGAARPIAWAVDPIPNVLCWHPATDDAVFTVLQDRSTIQKVSTQDLTTPLLSSTKTFGADTYYVECPTVVDAGDGGAYVVGWLERAAPGGTAAVGIGIARLTDQGATQWTKIVPEGGKNAHGVGGAALLSNGALAVGFEVVPVPGSLDQSGWVIGFYDDSGNELGRTKIPNVRLAQHDRPGRGPDDQRTPGTGVAHPRVLSALPDGGLLVAGTWDFIRYIECGSEPHVTDPVVAACSDGAANALIAKIDSQREVAWSARVGSAYATPYIGLRGVAATPDGTVLAAGLIDVERYAAGEVHQMGLAIQLGADGSVDWAKAYPWGPSPGARFADGGTSIDAVVPAGDGGFDAMFHPSNESNCRVLHVNAEGELSRVQQVKHPVGAASGYAGPCLASALDGAMTFSILGSFSRIERSAF
jgi:hypothetical protein